MCVPIPSCYIIVRVSLRFSLSKDDVHIRSRQFLIQKLGVATHLGEFGAVHERRRVFVTEGAELTECIFQGTRHGSACFAPSLAAALNKLCLRIFFLGPRPFNNHT